jgi:hypothetical protein
MSARRWAVVLAAVMLAPALGAQERDVRAELAARGAVPGFVDMVAERVEAAHAARLPAGPLIDKALEGWAKHVPAQRVAVALEQLRTRLETGRGVVVAAGMLEPTDAVVAGAAEALARGLTPEEVRALVTRAPGPEAAAAGLMVAASLHAQGLEHAASVRAVVEAYGADLDPARLYELPSVVAGLAGQGMLMSDLARRIMQGGGLPLPPMAGGVGQSNARPGAVPIGPGANQGVGQEKRRQ